jgi:RND family efflux transporter MFP subunit
MTTRSPLIPPFGWPAACLLLTFVFTAACGKQAAAPATAVAKAATPVSVTAAVAEARTVDRAISITGELVADESVAMRFEVAGRVQSIATDFGQVVQKGDVLAELDPREYQIQVERAKAVLTQALARVGLAANDDSTPTTTPMVRQAEAQLADAKSKFDAAAKLVKTGDVARERYNELEKAVAARQAMLDSARDDMKTLWANVASARADVKLAEKRLLDTVIRAPFAGAVMDRMVSPGQFIKDMENTPVVRIVKSDPLRLRVEIPESAAAAARQGSVLTFTTDASPGQTFSAVIRQINPSLDQKSRSLVAEARIPNPRLTLRPGTFVQVRLVTESKVAITTVPKAALYQVAGLTKLFAIRGGKAVEYKLPPGLEGGDWMEVPPGCVSAGEQVATSSLAALIDGAAVSVKSK